ncbi:OmpA/MotB family protein [Fulvivirga lutea]|uniref:OmpA family protein n=1 Tax=Fulvivirga lutea TaxID=2810512 RepID=A0A974WES3_9BACT|nr:OmpA family protein [Fulvivirga lutea]QSE96555.1 OmpA family protein [Fulvivirga lutea]
MRRSKNESNWISLADMMTGLMVIFMFIAINYILQIIEYKFVENDIYNALLEEFKKEIESEELDLSPDGTVTFNPENKILFNTGSSRLTRDFNDILDDFIPRYIETLSNFENIDYVKEIRIEGHTDNDPPKSGEDSYKYNLNLSSNRAQNVLDKLRNSNAYLTLPDSMKDRLEFLFTANGMSYSRALNKSSEIIYASSDKEIDKNLSRRVEFRVITSSDKLAEEIYSKRDSIK